MRATRVSSCLGEHRVYCADSWGRRGGVWTFTVAARLQSLKDLVLIRKSESQDRLWTRRSRGEQATGNLRKYWALLLRSAKIKPWLDALHWLHNSG